jgi:fructokinase
MIVVAGESLVDLIIEPSMRLVAIPGGGPFNTARTIARLGSDVAFLGRISTDRFGRDARARLAADGVRLDHVESTDDPSTLAVAELDDAGVATYRFYVRGTAAAGLTEAMLPRVLAARPTAVHVGTLGLVLEPLASTVEALVGALDAATILMVDVNARPTATPDPAHYRARVGRLLARADVVKVSVEDLAFLHPGVEPAAALAQVVAAGPSVVLQTDGGAPLTVALGERRITLPVPSVPIVDTVGAGDAFGGGFLHAWTAAGHGREALRDAQSVATAAAVGIRVAALTVGRAGAEPPFAAELASAGPAAVGPVEVER